MRPTIYNLVLVIIAIFIIRCIFLEFFPSFIINGYISIFVCFFLLTMLFTNNTLFSIIIGLFTINSRIIYRSIKDKKTLSEYNSTSNCLIFLFALILLSYILTNYEKINKVINIYYGAIIASLITVNLYSLKVNSNDNQLLCFA